MIVRFTTVGLAPFVAARAKNLFLNCVKSVDMGAPGASVTTGGAGDFVVEVDSFFLHEQRKRLSKMVKYSSFIDLLSIHPGVAYRQFSFSLILVRSKDRR